MTQIKPLYSVQRAPQVRLGRSRRVSLGPDNRIVDAFPILRSVILNGLRIRVRGGNTGRASALPLGVISAG